MINKQKLEFQIESIKESLQEALIKSQKYLDELSLDEEVFLFQDFSSIKFELLVLNMHVDKIHKKIKGEK